MTKATILGALLGVATAFVYLATGNLSGVSRPNQIRESSVSMTQDFDSGVQSALDVKKISSFEQIESFLDPFVRTVALFGMLSDANVTALEEFLEFSETFEDFDFRSEAQELIFRRWGQLDPVSGLKRTSSYPKTRNANLVAAVFREWSKLDLDAAVKHAADLELGAKTTALNVILETRSDLPETSRRDIAKVLGLERLANAMLIESDVMQSSKSPAETWERVVNDDVSDGLQRTLLYRSVLSGIEQEGLGFLINIHEDYEAWVDMVLILRVLQDAVQVYASGDPKSAYEEALKLPDRSSETACEAIVRLWAASDPIHALDSVSSLRSQPKRRRLQELILMEWAKTHPHDTLAKLRFVPAYLKPYARNQIIVELAIRDPTEAVHLLTDPSSRFTFESHGAAVLRYWMQNDLDAALAWLDEDATAIDWRSQLLPNALANLSLVDPQRAFEIGLKYGFEVSAMYGIVEQDLQLAMDLARKGNERNKAMLYAAIARKLVTQQKFRDALALSDSVPQEERQWYLSEVIKDWEAYYPRNLYESLDDIPQSLQSYAAFKLLRHHTEGVFTESESNLLQSLLNERHAEFYEVWGRSAAVVHSHTESAEE